MHLLSMFSKRKLENSSTPFSEFIRNASSAKKKQVYTAVLKKAVESQNAVMSKQALELAKPL